MNGTMKARTLRFASLLLAMVATAAMGQANHPDCIAQKKAEAEKGKLMEEVSKINERGREKKEDCQKSNSPSCQQELAGLRNQINVLNAKMKPFQDDIDKFKALCPESIGKTKEVLGLYEKVAKEACITGKGGDPKRCEDALFNVAEINYQADQRDNLANRERYEREWAKWKANEKRTPEPKPVQASFARGLAAHQRYLKDLPGASRRDVVLYRTAFIYDLMGRSPDAFPLLMEISRSFPNSRQLTASNLRLGEFYFVDKKYDSAIAYYNKVDVSQPGNESIVGLALYHKAEALYQKARYQTAADAFFDYIERADKGAFRGDLRSEAILYLGSCFAEFPESYKDGKKYFSSKGGRRYEDTLFYELAVKHADRDQHDQAIASLEYFLKTYPDYYKAPLAQIKLIEVWDKKKKVEEAQEAREQLVQKFGRTSPWWQKSRNIDKRELEQIQVRVRDVMLEVAMQLHFPGKERKDTNMVKKAIANYQRFIEQYKTEGNWPIYRANIYMADALSFVGKHEASADAYLWCSAENVVDQRKYREPSAAEKKLTQPVDAGYNAVVELQLAAAGEVERQGGDKVKAYNAPITKRYMQAVESYVTKFPKSPDVADLSYNLFTFQVNGQDWAAAIPSGKRLINNFPTYKYALDARARLAFAYTESKLYPEAESEYVKVIAEMRTKNDSLLGSMITNVGEVIWRMAENAEKAKKVDSAVYHFRRLAKEYPKLNIADSSAFRAAVAFENGKRYKEAAQEYLNFQATLPTSALAISALTAAAENFRNGKDTANAIKVLLETIYAKYPKDKDSTAFKGIAMAASLYDSSGRQNDKAKTLEIYMTRYPEHPQTPAFLYTAGLAYEKAKNWTDAVRIYNTVITKWPTHQYAAEAAFSVPIIEEKQGNKSNTADAYERFATQYPNDKSKVAKAYLRAATFHFEQKNWKKADELYSKLTKYYLEGQNAVQIDKSYPAEAYYKQGMMRTDSANKIAIGGTNDIKKIAEQAGAREGAYKVAGEYFDNAIQLLIEEWTLKSAYQQAENQMKILMDARDIAPPSGTALKAIQDRIVFRAGWGKGIMPILAAKAAKQYESFVNLTRKANIVNDTTKAAPAAVIRTYLITGRSLESIGDAIMEEPCPSKARSGSDQYNEECEFHKAKKEDNQITFQKLSVEKGYVPGIEKAAELGVVGPVVDSIKARITAIAPEDKSLQTQIVEKVMVATPQVKVDRELERAMARIKDIAEGDLSTEEKVRSLKAIAIEGQRTEQDLMSAIQELQKKKK